MITKADICKFFSLATRSDFSVWKIYYSIKYVFPISVNKYLLEILIFNIQQNHKKSQTFATVSISNGANNFTFHSKTVYRPVYTLHFDENY